jgi:exoribonuclease R
MLCTTNYHDFEIVQHNATGCGSIASPAVIQTFTGPAAASRALPGDYVEWDAVAASCTLINRTVHPPLTGLLDVCSKTIYGMTSRHVPIFLFYPYDKRYPPMRVGCATEDRSINLLATVRFDDWSAGETFPRANLETVIGPVGDLTAEVKALVAYASPFWRPKWKGLIEPTAAIAEHKIVPASQAHLWHIFHIDPEGCRDVDDIIGIQTRPDGAGVNLLIGISDVAAYIPAGSELDRLAVQNTSTVYSLGGRALRPMFPAALSEGLFSLRPGDPKPVIALLCRYDGNAFHDIEFAELLVPVHTTYSYESVMTEEGAAAKLVRQTLSAAAATVARRLAGPDAVIDVAAICGDSRVFNPALNGATRGSCDSRGATPACGGGSPASCASHVWIANLMILYNLEAAARLAAAGTGLFRAHKAVAAAALDSVSTLPAELQWVVSMPATYVAAQETHSQMGSAGTPTLYCHATSPIRRYADLANQRLLKEIIRSGGDSNSPVDPAIVRHLNDRQKTLKRYQRSLVFLNNILGHEQTAPVHATVVAIGPTKARLYIKEWDTLVSTVEYDSLAVGDTVRLRFYFNPGRPNWKERIVFETVN